MLLLVLLLSSNWILSTVTADAATVLVDAKNVTTPDTERKDDGAKMVFIVVDTGTAARTLLLPVLLADSALLSR